jgi:hypothetical protein
MRRTFDVNNHLNHTHLVGSAPDVSLSNITLADGKEIEFARAVIRTDTNEPLSIVSDQYTLVPHNRILTTVDTAIQDLGFSDMEVPRGIFFSKRGAGMNALYKFPSITERVAGNDICPLVKIGNSYDRTTRVTIEIGAFRFVCTNLAIGGFGASYIGFRAIHEGDIKVEDVGSSIKEYLGKFNRIADMYRSWVDTGYTTSDYEQLNKGILQHQNIIPKPHQDAKTRFDAYNHLTKFGSHELRSANASLNFLKQVNESFVNLN